VDRREVKQCKNRSRWNLILDMYKGGCISICTTCLLARYEPLVHDIELIRKPWIFRSRCSFSHSDDYREVFSDRLELVRLKLDHGETLEAFFDLGGFIVVGKRLMRKGKISRKAVSLLTPYGLKETDLEIAQQKTVWLAERLSDELEDHGSPWRVDGVRLNDPMYEVRIVSDHGPDSFRQDGFRTVSVPRNLIDDMTDSERPMPETQGRFRATVRQIVQDLKRIENAKGK